MQAVPGSELQLSDFDNQEVYDRRPETSKNVEMSILVDANKRLAERYDKKSISLRERSAELETARLEIKQIEKELQKERSRRWRIEEQYGVEHSLREVVDVAMAKERRRRQRAEEETLETRPIVAATLRQQRLDEIENEKAMEEVLNYAKEASETRLEAEKRVHEMELKLTQHKEAEKFEKKELETSLIQIDSLESKLKHYKKDLKEAKRMMMELESLKREASERAEAAEGEAEQLRAEVMKMAEEGHEALSDSTLKEEKAAIEKKKILRKTERLEQMKDDEVPLVEEESNPNPNPNPNPDCRLRWLRKSIKLQYTISRRRYLGYRMSWMK